MKRFNPNAKIDLEDLSADFDETASGFCPFQQKLVGPSVTSQSELGPGAFRSHDNLSRGLGHLIQRHERHFLLSDARFLERYPRHRHVGRAFFRREQKSFVIKA